MGCGSSTPAPDAGAAPAPAPPPARKEEDTLDLGKPADLATFGAKDAIEEAPMTVKPMSEEEMQEFQKEMDKEMDKILNAEEAVKIAEQDKEAAIKLFEEYDKDKSGSLDITELEPIMRQLGVTVTGKQYVSYVKVLLQDTDKDGNGKVNKKEFVKFYSKVVKSEETRSKYAKRLLKKGKEQDVRDRAKSVFIKYDQDQDSSISPEELSRVLEECLQLKLTPEQWEHYKKDMLSKGDKDGSGKLEFEEFYNFYKKCLASPGIIAKYEEKVLMRYQSGQWKMDA